MKYATLVGHSFTEKPGINITKTNDSLIFSRAISYSYKLRLILSNDVVIPPRETSLIEISSGTVRETGTVYVRGSLRGLTGREYYLMPGEYSIVNGVGALLIQNLSNNDIRLENRLLMTHAWYFYSSIDVNILDFTDPETINLLNYDKHLSDNEIKKLKELLHIFCDCFSHNMMDLGYTNVDKMEIELNDTKPVVYRPYRLSYPERELVNSMVKEMLEADIICESKSAYASSVLLVKKKTGDKRLCIDYRS